MLNNLPSNPEEWRAAVATAHACLSIDAARQYGLIQGGPSVNTDACLEMIAEGERRGVFSTTDEVMVAVRSLVHEFSKPRKVRKAYEPH